MRQQVRCIAHCYKTPNNKAHHQIQLSLHLHQKVNPKKPNKDKQDATTPHTKTSSENLSINRPWKQTKVRETLRKEKLGGLQHRIKILNRTHTQTGRPTDRPTDLWWELDEVHRPSSCGEWREPASDRRWANWGPVRAVAGTPPCRAAEAAAISQKNTHVPLEKKKERAFGGHWRRFFFFFFLVPWRILRAYYTTFEGILCHFWAHIMPLLSAR